MINCITFTALQPAEDVIDTMRWWWHDKGMRTCLTMFNPAGKGATTAPAGAGRRATRLGVQASATA